MVRSGTFREDLYFRINVFSLRLPPLRERREDNSALVEHFLEAGESKAQVLTQAMQMRLGYSWPGNIRDYAM